MILSSLIAFFQTPLGKMIFSFLLNELVKSGSINAAERLAVKFAWIIYTDLKGIKSFHSPDDFPNSQKKPMSICNLKTKDGIDVNK